MNRDFSDNLIAAQARIALNAGLTDVDVLRIIGAGSGGWLRGVAKRVEHGFLPESVAVSLVAARADAVSIAARLPKVFLFAIALPLRAARRVLQ